MVGTWMSSDDTAITTNLSLSSKTVLLCLGNGLIAWLSFGLIYRRFFHPLHKIPGPFWSSVTSFPSFYHNFIRHGKWYKEVELLHAQYGPIVRIGPNEVHLDDPKNYEKIYGNASNFYKDPGFYRVYGMERAMFCTVPNDLHRRRRAPLNHFFSKRAILRHENIVHENVEKLCRRVTTSLDAGVPVDLARGLRAMSVDIVMGFAFNSPLNLLDEEDFGAWFSNMLRDGAPLFWVFQQFPFVQTALESLPSSITRKLSSAVSAWETFISKALVKLDTVKQEISMGVQPERMTMFHQMLDPDVPEGRLAPSDSKPADEAMSITAAGADSTGNAIVYALFHTLSNPAILERVTAELRKAFPDQTKRCDWATLESLPYLNGVVKEAQRMSYGVIGRLPRVVPQEGAEFHGFYLPPGTTTSMSTWNMHRNAEAFPNPDTFDPERWLDPSRKSLRDRCFVPFSRGGRMCLGHALAMCELLVGLGTILRRLEELELCGVEAGDMVYEDYVGAVHPRDARPFKVVWKSGRS